MKFSNVALIFKEIEKTSGRLKITELLAGLFKQATPDDAKILAYLVLGKLNPPYIASTFSLAQKTMLKIVARVVKVSDSEVVKNFETNGDIGSVIDSYLWDGTKEYSVHEVYQALQAIESVEGSGSQEEKSLQLITLLSSIDPLSAKYIIRIILGVLRLGFSDMTLIDAFSWMEAGDKSLRLDLEHAYTVCADSGLIIYELKKNGIDAIRSMKIHVGIPIRPAAAERLENAQAIIEKLGPCVVEPKLDGFRLQVHVDMTGQEPLIRFFSRNLLDMSGMFPEFVAICKQFPVKSFIADCEAIVYDPNTGSFLPFQETVKRKRKHGIEELVSELPLQLNMFDLLYLDGKDLLSEPLQQRRALLKDFYHRYMHQNHPVIAKEPEQLSLFAEQKKDKNVSSEQSLQTLQVIQEIAVTTSKELEDFFLKEIGAGLEGVVVKKPNSLYQAGKRNFNWIKLKYQAASKLDDSIDVVILGYYPGRGKRAHFGIGAFLVGIYNEHLNAFQTLAKIGTGLTDSEWVELKKTCDQYVIAEQPKDVICAKDLYPAVWIAPTIVCEVLADEITMSPLHTAGKTEHTLGFALRFPRFLRYRIDKSVYQTTTVSELLSMHKKE